MADDPPADLDPATLHPALADRVLGSPLRVLGEAGSTNDVLLEAARDGAPEGTTVVADRQTAGRGRRGRSWHSPPGTALYLSVLLRPPAALLDGIALTLVAGLAVAEALEEVSDLPLAIKWPNDILCRGRKACGILAESSGSPERGLTVRLGLGINVNQSPDEFPPELRTVATSLATEADRGFPRDEVLVAVLRSLDDVYATLREGGEAEVRRRIRERAAWVGRRARVRVADREPFRARVVGLDPTGALVVDRAGTTERIFSGDVELLADEDADRPEEVES